MSNDWYIEDDESSWMQKQQDDAEYAEYLFQLQRDDELLEKANKQLRMAKNEQLSNITRD